METFRRLIGLLRKAQFLGYCASINLLLRIEQLFMNCKPTNYFTTGIRLHNWFLWIEKLNDNFKSLIWKHFELLYAYCARPYFLATAHHTIIFLLRNSQLFVYSKSTKYFTKGNRLNICLLCIEKLYYIFKSLIWNHNNDSYGYCANPNFYAPAHLLFSYCEYPNYLSTASRAIISTLEIV